VKLFGMSSSFSERRRSNNLGNGAPALPIEAISFAAGDAARTQGVPNGGPEHDVELEAVFARHHALFLFPQIQ
jgi:hypothetical protein